MQITKEKIQRSGQNIPWIADGVDWYISTSGHSYQKRCTVWDSLIQAKWQTQRNHMSCVKEAFSALRAQGVILWARISELLSQKEYSKALNLLWFVTLENFCSEHLGICKENVTICNELAFHRHSLETAPRSPRVHSSHTENPCNKGPMSVKRCKQKSYMQNLHMMQIRSSRFHDEKVKECIQNIILNAKARMKSGKIRDS